MSLGNQSFSNQPFMSGGFDGFGGGGGIMGLLLAGLLFGRGRGGIFGGEGCGTPDLDASGIAAKVVELMNSSNIREEIGALGNEVQQAFATQNLANIAQFNQVQNALCGIDKAAAVAALEAKIAAIQSQNAIQNSIETLSTKNDAQFATLQVEGVKNTQIILSRMDAIEIQNLRDQLDVEKRGRANREIEINVTQTNQQLQNQVNTQFTAQNSFLERCLGNFADQLNRTQNSIVNLGTMTATGQTNSAANTKVN